MKPIKIVKSLLLIAITIGIIMSVFNMSLALSYAGNSANSIKNTNSGGTKSGSAPAINYNVINNDTIQAYGRVNTQYMFGYRLEDCFTDADNDSLSYWIELNGGSKSQDLLTTITSGNSTYTSFVYTPTTVGNTVFAIYAYDGTNYSSPITVTLTAYPANTSNIISTQINYPSSVNDMVIYNSNGSIVSPISAGSNIYVLERGVYAFRGTPSGGTKKSGMTFDVPTAANVDGTQANPDAVYIAQANVTVNANSVAQQANKFSIALRDADNEAVVAGINTSNSTATTIPYLVYAHGNAELYSFEVVPGSTLSGYATLYQGNQTFTANTNTQNVTLNLPVAINYSLAAPTGATVKVFRQLRNYQTVEVAATGNPTTSGNYDTYTYKLPQNGSGYTYRVSKSGKITRAGFLSLSAAGSKTVDLSNDSPSLTLAQATASPSQESNNIFNMTAGYDASKTIGSRAEDSVLLNAHTGSSGNYSALYHNYINLSAGESYKIRGYRAAWQIINSDTANIMIEPDFNFEVVEGTASDLTLTQDSVHNSWCTVTPNTGASGVYVIKVTYDAIDVDGMSYSNNPSQRFYATAAGREGYLVINADSSKYADMALNAEAYGSRDGNMDWDSEIDTVYYKDSQGSFTFAPTISGKTIKNVKFSTTPNGTYSTITPNNGKYTVNPVQGYNMIKVTCTDNTVAYAPIRAAQVKILVDGNELNANTTVTAGNSHTIKLQGVYMPVPKFSGIYNPMMNKVNYKVGNSNVSGNNLQYNFITQNTITWTPSAAGTYNFTEGYHSMRMFCNTTAKWGHHRLLTDVGVGANFNAGLVNGVFNIYPDFSIKAN